MAAENHDDITANSDDMQTLRALMYSVKGLSPVSVTTADTQVYDDPTEAE